MPLSATEIGQGWTNWCLHMWWKQGPHRTVMHIDMMLDRMTRWGRRDLSRATEREILVIEHLKDLRRRMSLSLVGLNINEDRAPAYLDENPSPS